MIYSPSILITSKVQKYILIKFRKKGVHNWKCLSSFYVYRNVLEPKTKQFMYPHDLETYS